MLGPHLSRGQLLIMQAQRLSSRTYKSACQTASSAQNISATRSHDVLQSLTLQKKCVYGLGSYCGLLGYETVRSDRQMPTYRMNRDMLPPTSGYILNMKGYVPLNTLITTTLRTILWTLTACVHIHRASSNVSFIRRSRKIARSYYYLRRLSVRMEQLGSRQTDFHENPYLSIFKNLSTIIKLH